MKQGQTGVMRGMVKRLAAYGQTTRRSGAERWMAGLAAILALGFGVAGAAHAQVPLTNVAQISVGGGHTCVLTTAGGVKCWGANQYGQLGDNSTTERHAPVDVTGLTSGVIAVSAGGWSTCALTSSGGVKCWGGNDSGQVGDNSTTTRLTPVDVVGLGSGVAAIEMGGNHACALTTGGGVKCWGDNYSGKLGDNTTTTRLTPVDVVGLASGVAAISVGGDHNCARTVTGGAKCWGDNGKDQLGDNSGLHEQHTPVDVVGLTSGVLAISAGGDHTCAITTANGVKCWGLNATGQLGDGTTTQRLTAVDVVGLSSGVTAISTGWDFTCALTTAGGAKCWGDNSVGQIGDNSNNMRLTPVDVSGLTGMTAIDMHHQHTCTLTGSGGVKCWGWNAYGQLGDGSAINRLTPVDVLVDGGTSAARKTDLNGDGKSDLIWRNSSSGQVTAWLMNGTSASGSGVLYGGGDTSWTIAGTGDLNGDGKADLIWRNSGTGMVTAWLMNGTSASGSGTLYGGGDASWTVAGTGDLNGDGKADLLWRNSATGQVVAWLMNGTSASGTGSLYGGGDTNWTIAGTGDLNGDGKSDLIWRNSSSGQVTAWLMNGTTVSSAASLYGGGDTSWSIAGMGDLNGDGKSDLIWRNSSSGQVTAWLMNGTSASGSGVLYGGGDTNWTIAGTGDLNGDGKSDLIWRNSSSGQVTAWLMNGTTVSSAASLYGGGDVNWSVVGK